MGAGEWLLSLWKTRTGIRVICLAGYVVPSEWSEWRDGSKDASWSGVVYRVY